jgi:hypothetical protein
MSSPFSTSSILIVVKRIATFSPKSGFGLDSKIVALTITDEISSSSSKLFFTKSGANFAPSV